MRAFRRNSILCCVCVLLGGLLSQLACASDDGLGLRPTSVVAVCSTTNVILYRDIAVPSNIAHPLWDISDLSTNLVRSMERRRVLAAVENVMVSNVFSKYGLSVSGNEVSKRMTNLLNRAFGQPAFTSQMASNQQEQIAGIVRLATVCTTNMTLADEMYEAQYTNIMAADVWHRVKELCQTTNGLAEFKGMYPQEISPAIVSNQFSAVALRQLRKEEVIGKLIDLGTIKDSQGYVQWLYSQLDDIKFEVPELDPRVIDPPASPSHGGHANPEPPLPPAGPVP